MTLLATLLLLIPGRSGNNIGISVRDGVAVGHTQAWDIDGRSLNATTLSLRPLAFEIPGFLDASECDLLQRAANRLGMHRSDTKAQAGAPASALDAIDADENGMLDLDELRLTVEHWHDVSLDRKQALQMAQETSLRPAQRGEGKRWVVDSSQLSRQARANRASLSRWVADLTRSLPVARNRQSEHTFLQSSSTPDTAPSKDVDKLLGTLRRRLRALTGLPAALLSARNTDLQVVKYSAAGHYYHHHDSTALTPHLPCCHIVPADPNCVQCRFLTVLYYLNGVVENSTDTSGFGDGDGASVTELRGGATAFPVADQQAHFADDSAVMQWHLGENSHFANYCAPNGPGVRVKPSRGKAVLFYNHQLDRAQQWKGQIDWLSMHAACPVESGTKWLANHWVQLDDSATTEWEHVRRNVEKSEKNKEEL